VIRGPSEPLTLVTLAFGTAWLAWTQGNRI
jgi:hypothetical protein